ncbi:hypothetical protein BS47DRAFT_1373879 [Hydnum rufescens UP504]|uniref:Uncharacterized protein n=1 Tax=Hydnum rufescens UP504 TaxID=1448309 RepID=A0A9P6AKN6_9AGAM|nr:hypothetical protein BS47DRAFT_1373879 [Hydnum rufescens UP504]
MSIDYSGKFIKTSYPSKGVILVQLSRYWEELGSTFDKISRDTEIVVAILASSLPKAFTAGLDIGEAERSSRPVSDDPSREGLRLRDTVLVSISRYWAAHGAAFGLAIDILCACDIRYAASDTKFSIKEVDIGMVADIGTLARLPKITGNESLLRELAFTARPFGVAEASQLGFVSKVVEGSKDEVLAEALTLAKFIATKSPIALLGTKNVLLHSRDNSVQSNLEYVATWNASMMQSDDLRQSLRAFTTKRETVFRPLPKL